MRWSDTSLKIRILVDLLSSTSEADWPFYFTEEVTHKKKPSILNLSKIITLHRLFVQYILRREQNASA